MSNQNLQCFKIVAHILIPNGTDTQTRGRGLTVEACEASIGHEADPTHGPVTSFKNAKLVCRLNNETDLGSSTTLTIVESRTSTIGPGIVRVCATPMNVTIFRVPVSMKVSMARLSGELAPVPVHGLEGFTGDDAVHPHDGKCPH